MWFSLIEMTFTEKPPSQVKSAASHYAEKRAQCETGAGETSHAPDTVILSGQSASVGEADAALGTTAGQNLAAIAGSHALAETMDLGTMALLGLIGTNHAGTPPVLNDGYDPPSTTARQARRGQ